MATARDGFRGGRAQAAAVLDGSVDLGETRKCLSFLRRLHSRASRRHLNPMVGHRVNAVAPRCSPSSNWRRRSRSLLTRATSSCHRGMDASSDARAAREGVRRGDASSDVELASRLEWLEDFSARWDYRAGVERNQVAELDLSPDAQVVTMQAAMPSAWSVRAPREQALRPHSHPGWVGSGMLRSTPASSKADERKERRGALHHCSGWIPAAPRR